MIVNLDGDRVRTMREERWMSREELAAKAGIGLSTLRNIEVSFSGVRLSTARKLAKALGVPPKSLADTERSPDAGRTPAPSNVA
jgi:ribosome-binding protein aMBF1 (putative translation factor)